MWSKIELSGQELYIKSVITYDSTPSERTDLWELKSFSIYLTDFTKIFRQALNANEFKVLFDELNADLEVSNHKEVAIEICDLISNYTKENRRLKVEHKYSEDSHQVTLRWDSDSIPCTWQARLTLASPQEFFEILTKPLISSVGFLMEQRSQLFRIIRDKDLEIGEYAHSGVKLSLPHLKTEWFKPEQFMATTTVSQDKLKHDQLFVREEFQTLLQKSSDPGHSDLQDKRPAYDSDSPKIAKKPKLSVKIPEPTQKRGVERPTVKVSTKKTAVQKKLMKL